MSRGRYTRPGIFRRCGIWLRQRTTLPTRTLATALALVFLAATLGGTAREAQGYIPGTFPPSAGTAATVTVDVSHTPTSPEPKPGDTYQYKATFTLANMAEVGTTNEVVLTINADGNAPWTAVPTAANFTSTPAYPAPTTLSCTTTTCTVTYANIKTDGVITFTQNAKVASPLPNGTPILGTATAKIDTKVLSIKLEPVSKTDFPGQCAGTYTFVQKVGTAGAWLVDMKFADVAGQGKVILTPDGSTQIRAWNDPLAEGDTIKVISGTDGSDLTSAVMANATYRTTDPSSPFFIGSDPTTQSQFTSADWLDSLNWPYDTTTWTGNTWLPAGTVITVEREVTYLGCLPGGVTGDGTINREFGINTEIARANTSTAGFDYDVFSTPGTQAPLTCADRLAVSSNTGAAGNTTSLSSWKPGSAASTVNYQIDNQSDAIATSALHETRIFALRYNLATMSQTLIVVDTSTSPPTPKQFLSSNLSSSYYTAMAFDQNGNLWASSASGGTRFLTAAQVAGLVNGTLTTAAWTTGPGIRHPGTTAPVIFGQMADMAFDGNGNLYLAYSASNVEYIAKVNNFAANATASPMPASVTVTQAVQTSAGLLRGLAFVNDVLYTTLGTNSATAKLYTIDWKNTLAATAVSPTPTGWPVSANGGPSDLASCSFPKATDVTGPAFKVQKSVIQPGGTVAPAGTTSTQPATFNADGTLVVKYLVTVTAVGTASGSTTVTDTVTVPSGFTVSAITLTPPGGTATPVTSPFTITTGTLDPAGTNPTTAPISKTYLVTVTVKPNNPTAANWSSIGSCGSTDGGTAGSGVFNSVTSTTDTDGATNNKACIPVASAKLSLVKQIVDQNGVMLTSTDSQYFDLTAAGPSGLKGVSATSGAIGPSSVVVPGTYLLGEQGNDLSGAALSATYDLYATWSCVNVKTTPATVVPVTNGSISVAANQDIVCTIKNTKKPKVHIVKTATTPIADNTHIGQTITPAADGTFTANYTITVTNTSGFTTTTGPITDGFLVPAGLLWDGSKTATVTYNAGTTGATATGLVSSVTQTQLATWATLATSVANLPNNGAVTFTISIPLKLDLTVPAGSTQSVFETNAAALSSCASLTSTTGGTYTSFAGGIPNMTAINNEDLTHSSIAAEDNVACVPVKVQSAWAVEKATTGGVAGGTGPNLIATYDTVSNSFTATTTYTIKVTNQGTVASNHAAITDQITLPTGFLITDVTLGGQALTVPTPGASTMTFTIPPSTTAVPGGGSVTYTVVVSARITNPTGAQWAAAGKCDTANAGTPTFGGFFNMVTLTGDTDGTSNNDACVPVQEPKKAISLQKFGMNCDVNVSTCPVGGAQFAIYSVDPRTSGAAPIPGGITPNAMVSNGVPGSVFSTISLSFGKEYWLVETQSPTGLALLPQPIKFKVVGNGIWIIAEPGVDHGTLVSVIGDQFTFSVTNTTVAPLPKAGGSGFLPFLVFGLFLVAFGAAYHSKTSGRLALGFAHGRRAETGRHRAGGRRARRHHHVNP